MSNAVNENVLFSGIALNQSSTAAVFFHWFSAVLRLMFLLTMPSSLFAGLINRHVGLLAKFSLCS